MEKLNKGFAQSANAKAGTQNQVVCGFILWVPVLRIGALWIIVTYRWWLSQKS